MSSKNSGVFVDFLVMVACFLMSYALLAGMTETNGHTVSAFSLYYDRALIGALGFGLLVGIISYGIRRAP